MARDRREILAGLVFGAGLLSVALGVPFLILKIAYISDYGLAPAPFLAAISFESCLAVVGSSIAVFGGRISRGRWKEWGKEIVDYIKYLVEDGGHLMPRSGMVSY